MKKKEEKEHPKKKWYNPLHESVFML